MIHIFGFPWLRRIRSGEEKKQELGMVMMTRRGDKVGMRNEARDSPILFFASFLSDLGKLYYFYKK